MEWRTIDSAPKDGEFVLLYSPDAGDGEPFIARWLPDPEFPDGGAWWEKPDNYPFPVDADPSHWMPLPLAPVIP